MASQSFGLVVLLLLAIPAKRPLLVPTGPVTADGVVDVPAVPKWSGGSALTNVKDVELAPTEAIVLTPGTTGLPGTEAPAVPPVVPLLVSMLESLVSMADVGGSAVANLDVAARTTPPAPTTPDASS